MAGVIDNMKDKVSDMGDAARERYEMLRGREQEGTLNDKERTELQQLRERFEKQGG